MDYHIDRRYDRLIDLDSYENNHCYYYNNHQHYNNRDLFFNNYHNQGKFVQGVCLSLQSWLGVDNDH